jgi:hypothetical protein
MDLRLREMLFGLRNVLVVWGVKRLKKMQQQMRVLPKKERVKKAEKRLQLSK